MAIDYGILDGKFLARLFPVMVAVAPIAFTVYTFGRDNSVNDKEQTMKIVSLENEVKELKSKQNTDTQSIYDIRSDMRVMRITLERIEKNLDKNK